MKNKIVYIIVLTLALLTNHVQAYPDTFQFYGGAHVGRTFSGTVIKTDSNSTNGLLDIKTRPNGQFIAAGAFGGFRYFMDKIFTGFEFEFIKGGDKLTSKPLDPNLGDPWVLELKRRHQFVGSITAGWEETRRLLFYAKLGLGFINFEFVEGRDQPSSNKINQNVLYFVPALGGEYSFHDNVAMRFEIASDLIGEKVKSNSRLTKEIFQKSQGPYLSLSLRLGLIIKV